MNYFIISKHNKQKTQFKIVRVCKYKISLLSEKIKTQNIARSDGKWKIKLY